MASMPISLQDAVLLCRAAVKDGALAHEVRVKVNREALAVILEALSRLSPAPARYGKE